MAADGPLAGSGPGDLTRWQGTPWQSDAASCRSGYQPDISPVLPTFWPARIPNHVLREDRLPDRRRHRRRRWPTARPRSSGASTGSASSPRRTAPTPCSNMIEQWGELGIVTEQPGPTDGAFPAVMKVETHVGFTSEPTVSWNAVRSGVEPAGVGRRARHDAVVIGGGPAGSAAAATLARTGRAVLLVVDVRPRIVRSRIGEGGAARPRPVPSTTCSVPARSSPPTTCAATATGPRGAANACSAPTSCSTRSAPDGTSTVRPSTPACWVPPRRPARRCARGRRVAGARCAGRHRRLGTPRGLRPPPRGPPGHRTTD